MMKATKTSSLKDSQRLAGPWVLMAVRAPGKFKNLDNVAWGGHHTSLESAGGLVSTLDSN
ncbi:hypothetical protein E2C01_069479 [Portunus trituberculatus]|uniref:Uncharacterized protein n=1 Tax=Portunus trituberculatus TaxID=210409 RepID=A0A5B7I2X3_PORTR|nr:hypothetical protein [Portunus trituberculatus]